MTFFWCMSVGFAIADVVLLCLLRPICSLRRRKVLGIGLALIAGCALPVRTANVTKAGIRTCMLNQRRVYYVLYKYQKEHGTYPATREALIRACAPDPGTLHCPLDRDGSAKAAAVG